jgi:hypothetical protein
METKIPAFGQIRVLLPPWGNGRNAFRVAKAYQNQGQAKTQAKEK